MEKFSFRIVSDTSREKVFAEIHYNDEQWAEISQEEKEPLIALFPPQDAKYWEFPLEEALEALRQAKHILLE